LAEVDDFARLDALLDQALELPHAHRAGWVAATCSDDALLAARLRRLLALAADEEAVLPPAGGLRGAVWDDLVREMEEPPAAVRSGQMLGRYEIRGLLGEGAMGRVYRGYDPVLAREVAIKSLVHAWDSDAAALGRRRFEREARLLATLNHPNVAAIYGWEVAGGAPHLVLELVEGGTLADRLKKGPLGQAEAVRIALQIAGALEEAHRKGVVHRDLKPANVALDDALRVKVLDFGIARMAVRARAVPGEPSFSTEEHAVLGTAPYMSPEQVRGEPADTPTDVWAFGCVLYEMLVGRRLFDGRSPAEIMAAVLRDPLDWAALPAGTAPGLLRLLRRCLRRDPRERLRDLGDAALELQELDQDEVPAPVTAPPSPGRAGWLALAAVAVCGAGAFAAFRSEAPRAVAPPTRLSLELPPGIALADDYTAPFDLSADGTRLVLLTLEGASTRLFVRRLDAVALQPVPEADGAWQPTLSPDGSEVAYFTARSLKRAALDGSPAVTLAETTANQRGAAWLPDGSIVYSPSQSSGLARVPRGGGAAAPLTSLDLAAGEGSHRWPHALPGGRFVLFTCGFEGAPFDEAAIDAVAVATGERRRLLENAAYARYAAGRLFFVRGGRLLAAPFDPSALALLGPAELVADGVRFDLRNGGAHYAVADNGTIVYGPGAPVSTDTYLSWVDTAGRLTRITDTPRAFRDPRLSPDGRRVAARIGSGPRSDLWLVDADNGSLTRASLGLAPHRPIWTPDGRGVTVSAQQDGRWRLLTVPTAGQTRPQVVMESADRLYPNAWTPDGRSLVFQERREESGWDLRIVDVDDRGTAVGPPRDLAASPFQETGATLSQDGRYLAYDSDELDAIAGVYVAPLADPAARTRASELNVRWPRWRASHELFCWYPPRARPRPITSPEGVHRIQWAAARPAGRSEAVWPDPQKAHALVSRLSVATYASYDVDTSARGLRFLMLENSAPPATASLAQPVVVLDWRGTSLAVP
jgi:eukaryotic-like serine/threonine-protein kinase